MESKTFEIEPIQNRIALLIDAIEVLEDLYEMEECEEEPNMYLIEYVKGAAKELDEVLGEEIKNINEAIEFNRINPPADIVIHFD